MFVKLKNSLIAITKQKAIVLTLMIDTEFECWVDLNLAQGGYAGSQKTLLECESSQRGFARLPELRWSRETIFMPAYFFPEGQARVGQKILKTERKG